MLKYKTPWNYSKEKIGFQYLRIFDLFLYKHSNIKHRFFWSNTVIYGFDYDLDSILRFISQLDCKPLINLNTSPLNIDLCRESIGSFLKYCERKFW